MAGSRRAAMFSAQIRELMRQADSVRDVCKVRNQLKTPTKKVLLPSRAKGWQGALGVDHSQAPGLALGARSKGRSYTCNHDLSQILGQDRSLVECHRLLHPGAWGDLFGKCAQHWLAVGANGCGQEHAVRLKPAHLPGREIRDDYDSAPDQILGGVSEGNSRENLPSFISDVDKQFQQFVRALNSFRRFHLADAQLNFREIVNANFVVADASRSRRRTLFARLERSRGSRISHFLFHCLNPFLNLSMINARKDRLRFRNAR